MEYDMPQIRGIDWEAAHRYLPSKSLLLGVLDEFIKTASKQTKLLEEYAKAVLENGSKEDYSSFRIQAHAMKSSLRSIGSDLFDEAYALELAGKDENATVVEENTEHFVEEYLALASRLEKVVVVSTSEKKDFNEDEFFEKIGEIKKAMDAFDISALQGAFKGVREMAIPEIYKEWIEKLEPAVRDLDSDEVMTCCQKIEEIRK